MKRTNQGGSVLSFIIIGGVLTLLLVGGVYMLRQYNQSSTVAVETPAAPAPDSTNQAGEPSTKPSESDKSANEEQKPSDSTETPTTMPGSSSNESTSGSDSEATDSTIGSNVGELPQTGPAESASALVAMTLLAGTSVAYMQSRRQSSSL